jgi:hypothetical protein
MRDWLTGLTRLLGQLRLWQQFVLLGLFVVIVPIISTTLRFLMDGQAILTEHEIIDLSDEANLRVDEFREEIDQKEALKSPKVCEEHLAAFVGQWPIQVLKPGQTPSTVGQVRRRYFDQCIVVAGVVNCEKELLWGPRIGPESLPITQDTKLDPAVTASVMDLIRRVRRPLPNDPSYVSARLIRSATSRSVGRAAGTRVNRPISWC